MLVLVLALLRIVVANRPALSVPLSPAALGHLENNWLAYPPLKTNKRHNKDKMVARIKRGKTYP
jgi:hypothetical protein